MASHRAASISASAPPLYEDWYTSPLDSADGTTTGVAWSKEEDVAPSAPPPIPSKSPDPAPSAPLLMPPQYSVGGVGGGASGASDRTPLLGAQQSDEGDAVTALG